MIGAAVVDTNLLGLLVVGSASRSYIKLHKRIGADFAIEHFELLVELLGSFDDIVLIPQIVAEISNLIRQINYPAKNYIQIAFKKLIETSLEFPATSRDAIDRDEFFQLGIMDCCILHMCSLKLLGAPPTLLTIDSDLVNAASSLGYSVINYREFMN
jgi:hypothetical protein